VFKVEAFRFDASVKTSSPLLDCRVNHWLVTFIPCRPADAMHWRSSYKVKVALWKAFWANCLWCYQNNKRSSFYTEITFI